MKRFLAILFLLPCFLAVAAPPATISVSNADPFITESWTARITFFVAPLEGRYAGTCPLSSPSASPFPSFFDENRTGLALRGFPIDGVRFSHDVGRQEIDGINYWRITLVSDPIPAEKAGRIDVGPVTVEAKLFDGRFQRGFFGAEAHTVLRRFTAPRITVTVHEPPRDGRPASYCGAIGSNVTAVAHLDASICTAGDPLVLTLSVAGATDPSRIRAPEIGDTVQSGGTFRVDASSVKSRIDGTARVVTWRVRARQAGTVEFPALPVAFFDVRARKYRILRTESIPVQVKAGAQVALGLSEDDADGEGDFPMPDGLDLDFPDAGTAAFTFSRAVSLAGRAAKPEDFAKAAQAYADYLSQLPEDPLARLSPLSVFDRKTANRLARHCANLGALRLMGGDARGAIAAYSQSSAFAGDDASLLRGIRASFARLKNDPRADLPITRILFPFWFRLTLLMRVVASVAVVLALGLVWWLAGRLGRGGVLVFAVAFLLVPDAAAQWSFRSSFGNNRGGSEVKATVALVPSETVVGEPAALVFSFDVENGVDVDQLGFRNLPDPEGGKIEYGEPERLPDGASAKQGHLVRRVRLPIRFMAPFAEEIAPVVVGMLVTRRGNGTSFSFTSSVNFSTRCAPVKLAVDPLPEKGKPKDFSGAIGRNFRLRQRLSPAQVHPGDLVTAEYTLTFDGYFPTNVLPKIEGLEKNFKAYEPKETSRTDTSVSWRQMLVPQTPAATNAATLALDYYDVASKRYATVRTTAGRLVFVSGKAASTENTAVLVDAQSAASASADTSGPAKGQPVTLRFAPSDVSPAVAVIPPGVEMKTLSRHGDWRRVETPRAIGWTK